MIGKLIFSQILDELMQARGTKQKELATACGVNQASVHGWLQGSLPRADAFQRIALFFGVTMESLLTKDEAPSEAETQIRVAETPPPRGWRVAADSDIAFGPVAQEAHRIAQNLRHLAKRQTELADEHRALADQHSRLATQQRALADEMETQTTPNFLNFDVTVTDAKKGERNSH